MDLELRDKVYVVTGGSAGLGFAAAQELVANGARVVLSGRNADRVASAVTDLGGERVTGVIADNADPATAEQLEGTALERFGRLDGLLVSVGGPPPATAMDASDEQWRAAFESIFLGAVRLARTMVPRLPDGGSIAFVLSTSVRAPVNGLGISNGLRPGLGMVAKSLASELGPAGIRVNGLLPGWTETNRLRDMAETDPGARRAAEAAIPLRRVGRAHEFGRVAAFVLSPAASYVTGAMIPVDGGVLPGI